MRPRDSDLTVASASASGDVQRRADHGRRDRGARRATVRRRSPSRHGVEPLMCPMTDPG